MLTRYTRTLIYVGIALVVIIMAMSITSNALNNKPIPPPPSNTLEDQPKTPEKEVPVEQNAPSTPPQPPPPPEPIDLSNNGAPPLPPPPPRDHLVEDALRELEHAYTEITGINRIIEWAEDNGYVDTSILELWNESIAFYNKAYQLYNSGDYILSKIYAHLTIECLHGLREVLSYNTYNVNNS